MVTHTPGPWTVCSGAAHAQYEGIAGNVEIGTL